MRDTDRLDDLLTRLRLTAIRDQLDSLLDEAGRAQMTLREALLFLAEREVARRDTRRIQMGMKLARFPCVRTLEGFDFDAQPSIDPGQIRDLATGRWVGHGQALLLLGPPGVGKTHLAVALGREAVERGYTVLFNSAVGHLFFQLVSRRYKRADQQQPAGRRRFPEAPEGVGRPDPG